MLAVQGGLRLRPDVKGLVAHPEAEAPALGRPSFRDVEARPHLGDVDHADVLLVGQREVCEVA
jgi:hypothetical protein